MSSVGLGFQTLGGTSAPNYESSGPPAPRGLPWKISTSFIPSLYNDILYTVPHSKQAKENVMHYKRAAEEGTSETYEQTKAKEEEINTAEFTRGEYATLCRGDTSQVPVFSLLVTL